MIELLVLLGYCLGSLFLIYFLPKKATTNEKGIIEESLSNLVVFLLVFSASFVTLLFGGLLLWSELYIL